MQDEAPSQIRADASSNRSRIVRFTAVLVLLSILLPAIVLTLRRNEGHLAFTLDDPYIHLAVAEEIARGGYGVNKDESAAP